MSKFLEKAFGFDSAKHNVRTEIVAGITTFLTMAYILAVNPSIFGALETMPKPSVFTATALAAVIATLVMAFYAKKPFALAPGMGLNAFFVFTVCLTMGYTWQFALTAVFIEGIIFIILSVTNVRTWILNSIPISLKNAIGGGIGLFIAFIGLQNAGLIVNSDATLVTLGDVCHGTGLLAVIGIVISSTLVILHIRGGILLGILATTVIGLFIKDPATGETITKFGGLISAPASVKPIFCQFEWNHILSWDMVAVVFTFLFIDMFDTMGTVIGVSQKAGFVDEKGNVDGIDRVFMAACCFALALVFSPLFLSIPGAATAPSLIIVGMMMMQPVTKIEWTNYRESIPAFLTLLFMPCAYSISDGILLGCISYVVLYTLSGKAKQITPTMWVLAALFILRYIFF